jgi:hypothetical protein
MANITDLSKGYLPVVMVVSMLISCWCAAYWLSSMASTVNTNAENIVQIRETLKVLPSINTEIAIIKRELGIENKETAFEQIFTND